MFNKKAFLTQVAVLFVCFMVRKSRSGLSLEPEDDEDFGPEGSGLGDDGANMIEDNSVVSRTRSATILEPSNDINVIDSVYFKRRAPSIADAKWKVRDWDSPAVNKIHVRPIIKVYPREQSIYTSQYVVIRCRDESDLRLPVRWTRVDKRPLPPGTIDIRGRLSIPSIRMIDDGDYKCSPLNSYYANYYSLSTVNVLPFPIDSSPCPRGQKVCAASRHCILDAYFCDGESDCDDGSDELDCSFICSAEQYRCSSGQCVSAEYRCDKKSDCDDGSDEMDCTPPYFISYPAMNDSGSRIYREGDNVTLTCHASGFPPPNIRWKHKGIVLGSHYEHANELRRVTNSSVAGLGILRIVNISPKDAGSWICLAENALDSVHAPRETQIYVKSREGEIESNLGRNEVVPNVDSPIRVVVHPTYLERERGRTASFSCSTNAIGAKVEWRSDSGSLPSQASTIGGQLTIPNVNEGHAGYYYCRVTDSLGRYAESRGQLQVRTFGGNSTPLGVIVTPRYTKASPGDMITLRCDTTQPVQQLEWSLNGRSLPPGTIQPQQNVVQIDRFDPRLAGTYVCRALLDSGVSSDQGVVEMVPYETRTHINVYPSSIETNLGQRVEFVCNTTDLRPSIIRWKLSLNGQLPPGIIENKGVLTIPSVEPHHYGTYICTLSNSFGMHRKDVSLIRPRQSMAESRLTVNPRVLFRPPGSTAEFDCSSSIYSSEDIRWTYYRDRPLPQDATVRGSKLIIQPVGPQHYGSYQCVVKNEASGPMVELLDPASRQNPSPPIPLPVRPDQPQGPLEAVIEPNRQSVPQASTARMICMITSGPRASQITWSKVNGQLSDRHRIEGNTMIIENLKVSDRGLYVCNVRSPNGASITRASAILEVEAREPPLLKIYPNVHQTIPAGGSALFQCRVESGTPEPVVRWVRVDGMPIMPTVQITENGVIRFTKVTGAEKGVYKCEAENVAGKAAIDVTFDVTPDPKQPFVPTQPEVGHSSLRIAQPNPYLVRVGQAFVLDCQTNNPGASLEWAKIEVTGKRPLTGRMPIRVMYKAPPATVEHSGVYLCIAADDSGPTESSIRVVVRPDATLVPQPVAPPSGSERVSIEEGGTFEASCESSIPAFWLQFSGSRSNVRITDRYLKIEPVTSANTGEYACYADYPAGARTLVRKIRLEVGAKAKLRIVPEEQTVTVGDNVAVYCGANGHSDLASITWTREAGQFGANVVAREGDLRLTKVQQTDSGIYVCIARSQSGSVIDNARAIINVVAGSSQTSGSDHSVAPRRPSMGHRLSVDQLAAETLRCQFPNLPPHQIFWEFQQSKELPENAQVVGNDVALTNINKNNEGRYICNAKLPGQDRVIARDFYDLTVRDPGACSGYEFQCTSGTCIDKELHCNGVWDCHDKSDEFYCSGDNRQPPRPTQDNPRPYQRPYESSQRIPLPARVDADKSLVRVGENVTLKCVTNSYNPQRTRYQWLKDKKDLEVSKVERTQVDRDTVTITEASSINGGVYMCRAFLDSMYGTAEYVLILHSDPTIIKRFEKEMGDSASFACPGKDTEPRHPNIQYRWEKEELNGTLPENVEVRSHDGGLTIRKITANNAGVYECISGSPPYEKRSKLQLSVRLPANNATLTGGGSGEVVA